MMPVMNQSSGLRGLAAEGTRPRLIHAAQEFEAMMMKELVKPMTDGGWLKGEENSENGSTGVLGEFASEALGRTLSERGGFGFADRIVQQLGQSRNRSGAGEVTKTPHGNTAMGSFK